MNPFSHEARKTRQARKAARKALAEEERAERLALWTKHKELLDKAAGVSRVSFTCHADTWNFVNSRCRDLQGSYGGGIPEADTNRMVKVYLSGPNLAAILSGTNTRLGRRIAGPVETAISDRVYEAVARSLQNVDRSLAEGAPVPDIVIDDRTRPEGPS